MKVGLVLGSVPPARESSREPQEEVEHLVFAQVSRSLIRPMVAKWRAWLISASNGYGRFEVLISTSASPQGFGEARHL
jgi:hypothetical protein